MEVWANPGAWHTADHAEIDRLVDELEDMDAHNERLGETLQRKIEAEERHVRINNVGHDTA